MITVNKIISSFMELVKSDKSTIYYLLYFSAVEALLTLVMPLTSVFVINSVLAHAAVSIVTLGVIIVIAFIFIIVLQFVKEYIIEKFQQKIFVKNAITIAKKALAFGQKGRRKADIDKYMNYFFDITSIQKLFPVLLLDGIGMLLKSIVSLLLLLAFNPYLFLMGLFFLLFFIVLIYFAGKNGFNRAIERSDSKHASIYFLQQIPYEQQIPEKILETFDTLLSRYVQARTAMFKVIIRQLLTTYLMEGTIFLSFILVGGYLVIEGNLPVGEFVASEIVVVTMTSALKTLVKQIDYMYEVVEGLYKVEKLSVTIEKGADG
jgi:ABC-type bacteriocin/lantibiotic exporter with double-glycine peptidase domain